MPPSQATRIATALTDGRVDLEGQRVAVVGGIDHDSQYPRHAFTGGELDMIVELAANCWGQQRNGALGRPSVNQAEARLAMRAYYSINGLGTPSAEQLRTAHSSDHY
jgi:hypothetical protein